MGGSKPVSGNPVLSRRAAAFRTDHMPSATAPSSSIGQVHGWCCTALLGLRGRCSYRGLSPQPSYIRGFGRNQDTFCVFGSRLVDADLLEILAIRVAEIETAFGSGRADFPAGFFP